MGKCVDEGDELVRRIKERVAQFCADNFQRTTKQELLIIENAMMIGATVRLQMEQETLTSENDALQEKYAVLATKSGDVKSSN